MMREILNNLSPSSATSRLFALSVMMSCSKSDEITQTWVRSETSPRLARTSRETLRGEGRHGTRRRARVNGAQLALLTKPPSKKALANAVRRRGALPSAPGVSAEPPGWNAEPVLAPPPPRESGFKVCAAHGVRLRPRGEQPAAGVSAALLGFRYRKMPLDLSEGEKLFLGRLLRRGFTRLR